MKQEVVFSNSLNIDDVIIEIKTKLSREGTFYNAVIFFASSNYDFPALSIALKEYFPNAEVIGTSTSGEISASGFTNNSIVISALSCDKTKFSGLIIDDVDKYPIIHKDEIEQAALDIGIRCNDSDSHRDAFAITFVNGLCNAEEALLSLFYAVIQNDKFMIAGGSAGDDLKFQQTYVSYNGKCVSHGAVILFVKTKCIFDIRKENIFSPSGTKINITRADTQKRVIYEIDGINAKKRYAELLGVPETSVDEEILNHPFGRVFGGNVFISSLASFNPDGSINMYSRVLPNTTVEILNKDDSVGIASKNCQNLKSIFPEQGCVIIINCILRTIGFNNDYLCGKMTQLYTYSFKTFAGFSSYGEQIGKINSNQTFVSIIIGE